MAKGGVSNEQQNSNGEQEEFSKFDKFLEPNSVKQTQFGFNKIKISNELKKIILESIIRCSQNKLEDKELNKLYNGTEQEYKYYIKGFETHSFSMLKCNNEDIYEVIYYKYRKGKIKTDKKRCIKDVNNSIIYNNKYFDYVNLLKNGKVVALIYTKALALYYYDLYKVEIEKYLEEKNKKQTNSPLFVK